MVYPCFEINLYSVPLLISTKEDPFVNVNKTFSILLNPLLSCQFLCWYTHQSQGRPLDPRFYPHTYLLVSPQSYRLFQSRLRPFPYTFSTEKRLQSFVFPSVLKHFPPSVRSKFLPVPISEPLPVADRLMFSDPSFKQTGKSYTFYKSFAVHFPTHVAYLRDFRWLIEMFH